VDASANCATPHPFEETSPEVAERLPELESVVAALEAVVDSAAAGNGLPVQLAASVVIVVPLDAQSTGPGVEPFKIKLPLEKTLAELVNTAVNMVAAAMVGTRMNQRVPSPTVAKMRNG
jgi:hypothetical protein